MDSTIEIEVCFLSAEQGGRQQPPTLKEGTYRPHLRMSPHKTLLGVVFVDGPLSIQADIPFRAIVRPLYAPSVDYSPLAVGVHFDLMEGPRVVGHGVVIRSA